MKSYELEKILKNIDKPNEKVEIQIVENGYTYDIKNVYWTGYENSGKIIIVIK